jgi:ring-1,2-phenylacetyl-CoA epoxidase subunit PaaC
MFFADALDEVAISTGFGVDVAALKTEWDQIVSSVLNEATLNKPTDGWFQKGGHVGKHTEHLGALLSEMQYMQRTFPNSKW